MNSRLLYCVTALLCTCALSAWGQENLIINGDFQLDANFDGWPDGWKRVEGFTAEKSGDNVWLSATNSYAGLAFAVPLKGSVQKIKFSAKLRATDVVVGRESWQDGRIALEFRDKEGKQVGKFPRSPGLKGSVDWTSFEYEIEIPSGVAYLHANMILFGQSGKIEFDDLYIGIVDQGVAQPNPPQPKSAAKRRPKAALGTELVVNGDLENGASGWDAKHFPDLEMTSGNHYAVLSLGWKTLNQTIELPDETSQITLIMKAKADNIVVGVQSWDDGRLAMSFHDADGTRVGEWPNVYHVTGSTEWELFERTYDIPQSATTLKLGGYMRGKSGTLYLDDISVKVTEHVAKPEDAICPIDADSVWSAEDAWIIETPTRTKVCLNGLWKFYPVFKDSPEIPVAGSGWGWFKVPGMWPTSLEASAQEFVLPAFHRQQGDFTKMEKAWYERKIAVPEKLKGRRIFLDFEMIQAQASVFVNGRNAGEIMFPGGMLDVTSFIAFGADNRLDILVSAQPPKAETDVVMDVTNVFKADAKLRLKGLTGDVYLVAVPEKAAVDEVRFSAKTDDMTLKTEVSFLGEVPRGATLEVVFLDGDAEVHKTKSAAVKLNGDGYASVETTWADAKLWDVDSPQNLYEGVVIVREGDGKILDQSFPVRFGFREFKIVGRDFLLNGTPIHWRTLLADNINGFADSASLEGSAATLAQIKAYGFNSAITHNYHFKPGEVGYMKAFFDAADAAGVMTAFSLPHGSDFDWDVQNPAVLAEYEKLCRYLIRKAWNHPSIVLYTMNHNQCGYAGDLNPLAMDGIQSPEFGKDVNPDATREKAKILQGIAKKIDPTRPVYHHSSGNLGDIHSNNIYLNWSPVQERDDWIQYWAEQGVKPLFFVEWGLPHIASWSSYRGPKFIWRTDADQSIWDSEFAATFLGDEAYRMTPAKTKQLTLEESLWAKEEQPRWGHLCQPLRSNKSLYYRVTNGYLDSNWRNFRALGLTACLPWDQELIAERNGRAPEPMENPAKYEGLKKPGIVADRFMPAKSFIGTRSPEEFRTTEIGETFKTWNKPVISWIAGKPEHFTEKAANFRSGDTVVKQLAFVNDSRKPVSVTYRWRVNGIDVRGKGEIEIAPGKTAFAPMAFDVPATAASRCTIEAEFEHDGETMRDAFAFNVVKPTPTVKLKSKVALFDPVGDTAKELDKRNVKYTKIEGPESLAPFGLLVVGRGALATDRSIEDIGRVRQGLNVLIFEQTAETLQNKLGFRVNEQGLRQLFAFDRNGAFGRGFPPEHFMNWQGESTTLPPYIAGPVMGQPKWDWAGFENTRVWRNRNWGNVGHALIEKPSVGNFMPILGGGFDMQYAALMTYQEGRGTVVFCQTEVTGRTVEDPVAQNLFSELLAYAEVPKPRAVKPVFHLKDEKVEKLLGDLRIKASLYDGKQDLNGAILVVGPESRVGKSLMEKVAEGASVVCLNLDAKQIAEIGGGAISAKNGSEWPGYIEDMTDAVFDGLCAADFYNRTLKLEYAMLPSTEADANRAFQILRQGKGVLVLSQIAPWNLDYEHKDKGYLRTTYRRNLHLTAQVLRNLGADSGCDILDRLGQGAAQSLVPLPDTWRGMADPAGVGEAESWMRPDFDDSAWRKFKVPGAFDDQYVDLHEYNGYFWYRIKFDRPTRMTTEKMNLFLGAVDDESTVWLNGKHLGTITAQTHPKDYWIVSREFDIDRTDLLEKGNVLVVRVNDTYLKGGIMGNPALKTAGPWLNSYYLQTPKADDDPYRFYRW